MRCPRCQHDNREGARFCGACGDSLELAAPCPHCGTANPPSQRFCDACGHALAGGPSATTPTATPPAREPRAYTPRHLVEKILGTRSALEGERKQVTVLFADVVESMRLAEWLGPEPWHRVLDRVFEILIRGVHQFEGTINQFTGDGIMALFGARVAHEDHARRACHAALTSAEELRAYARTLRARSGLDLAVRMGINSGEVVVGKIGDDLRMDYTAQGHCVGLAARVERLAAPGTVLITQHTARLVEGFFAFADLGARELKGVREMVRVFELQGIGAVRTRLEASGRRGLSCLIGREGELAWLEGLLARAADWNGQVVGIVGDAGVGKSRVCLEFVERCRAAGVAVYEVHCPAHGATVPWLAARELLRSCLGIIDDDGRPRRIEAELTAIDPDLMSAVPLVLEVLGQREFGVPGTAAEPLIRGLAGVLQRVLRARGAREPLVLVLDDAHWMDASSQALVSELLRLVLDSRVLVIANFRSEFRPPWIGGSGYHQLALSPLGEAASHELRLHAAVAAALERLHVDRLGEHAELIAYHLKASGMRFEAARWRRRAALKVSNIKIGGRVADRMSPPRRRHPSR